MLGNVPAPRDPPPSASATGELAAPRTAHVERIRAASASAFAPATRRAYGGSWAQFLAWADGEGLQALPAPPAAVAAHIEAGGPDPTASEGVRRVLRGLLLPSPQRVAPAPPKSLREARPSSSRSFLECRTRHSGLADDRHQRAGAQLSMNPALER